MAAKIQYKDAKQRKQVHDLMLSNKTALAVCEWVRDNGKEFDLPDTLICMAQMYRG